MPQQIKVQDGSIIYSATPAPNGSEQDLSFTVNGSMTINSSGSTSGIITTTPGADLDLSASSGGKLKLNNHTWLDTSTSVQAGGFIGASGTDILTYYQFVLGTVTNDNLTDVNLNLQFPNAQVGQFVIGPTTVYQCVASDTWRFLNKSNQVNAPTSTVGQAGDHTGMFAFDATHVYYCTANYDGVTQIWAIISSIGNAGAVRDLTYNGYKIPVDGTNTTNFSLMMYQDGLLQNPAGLKSGDKITITVQQNEIGNHILSYDDRYIFSNPVTVGTAPHAVDILEGFYTTPGYILLHHVDSYTPSIVVIDTSSFDSATRAIYDTAINNAPLGSKRLAGANAIVNVMTSTYHLNIFRDGVLIIPSTFSGAMTVVDDGTDVSISLGTIVSSGPILAADLSTGTWLFELRGGTGLNNVIRGSVGPAGSNANLILDQSPFPGMGFSPQLSLVIPRSLDGSLDSATLASYNAAIASASIGNKRVAGANSIITSMSPAHRLYVYQNSTLIVPAFFTGDMVLVNDGVNISVSPGPVTSTGTIVTADLNVGTWTFSLQGGPLFSHFITGTVGLPGSGADLILSSSPTTGGGFSPILDFVIPRSLDGLS